MPQEKRVLIIGAGIGGLSAAYYLQGQTSRDGKHTYRCTLVEKERRPGGNAYTAYFDRAFEGRFADLGVNDFNRDRYPLMVDLLRRVADDGFPVPTGNLWDETCYFTARGDNQVPVCYTSVDMRNGTTDQMKTLQAERDRFDGLVEKVLLDPKRYGRMSVGKFLEQEKFDDDFRRLHVLPRINAMYYMNRGAPDDMPIWAVMMYYHFQEGAGGKADRHYFVHGASQWILQLGRALEKRGVVFHPATTARVVGKGPGGLRVDSAKGISGEWDYVVSAVPANRVSEVIAPGVFPEIEKVTPLFEYIDTDAYAHRYEGVMPPDRSRWETYNVLIPGEGEKRLYTMSYVENMHQGAHEPPPAPWFVSENPQVEIPKDRIEMMVNLNFVGPSRVPAVVTFPHNTLTVESLDAQRALCELQGKNDIFFTGGWTNGAGLHEEILAVSQDVSSMIRGLISHPVHGACSPHPSGVPKYIRDSFAAEPVQLHPDGFWE